MEVEMGLRSNISKLSDPVLYEGDSFTDIIATAYNDFYNTFLEKHVKPQLFQKDIFFNMDRRYKEIITLKYPERFIHIISLDDEEKYTMNPCTNDISYEYCPNQCKRDSVLTDFMVCNRWECPYRLSRIHWIKEIVSLANSNDKYIKRWYEPKNDGHIFYRMLHLRYVCGIDDYLLVFKECDNWFQFVTAFPVVSKYKKEKLDKAYDRYK